MSGEKQSEQKKNTPQQRSRSRLSLTRFAWGMVAVALLLGMPAAITGIDSIFIWLDVGFCLCLATVLFIIGLKGCRSHPRGDPAVQLGGSDQHRWRDTAIVLAAVIAIFSPVVTLAVEVSRPGLGPIVKEGIECKAQPYVPPAEAPRS